MPLECREWSKSDWFAPVLCFDSLCYLVSLAVQNCCGLKQGDCKNAFYQGILSPEEITIIRPPSGDPDAAKDKYWWLLKTLSGLRRSPCHWYDKIDSMLHSIGLTPNAHDPCLYTGFVRDPWDPSASHRQLGFVLFIQYCFGTFSAFCWSPFLFLSRRKAWEIHKTISYVSVIH